jgi:hypothetical protein
VVTMTVLSTVPRPLHRHLGRGGCSVRGAGLQPRGQCQRRAELDVVGQCRAGDGDHLCRYTGRELPFPGQGYG